MPKSPRALLLEKLPVGTRLLLTYADHPKHTSVGKVRTVVQVKTHEIVLKVECGSRTHLYLPKRNDDTLVREIENGLEILWQGKVLLRYEFVN